MKQAKRWVQVVHEEGTEPSCRRLSGLSVHKESRSATQTPARLVGSALQRPGSPELILTKLKLAGEVGKMCWT